jgi:hypothetical protein
MRCRDEKYTLLRRVAKTKKAPGASKKQQCLMLKTLKTEEFSNHGVITSATAHSGQMDSVNQIGIYWECWQTVAKSRSIWP